MRKLINYINKLKEFQRWKKTANPEDVEYQEIEIEVGRGLLLSYCEPERIFADRKNDETGEVDYYVKWKNLPYCESTWEDSSIITQYYQETLDRYKQRMKAKSNPKNYKESMKTVKKKFVPFKTRPDYIGSETLQLRDYQLDGVNFLLDAWHKVVVYFLIFKI